MTYTSHCAVPNVQLHSTVVHWEWCFQFSSAHFTAVLVANRRSLNWFEVETENWSCVTKIEINIYI